MIGYYYCSLNTFLNIIKNKQIYLSDPLKMNDGAEIIWYLSKLNDQKKRLDKKAGKKLHESVFDQMQKRAGFDFTYEELIDSIKSTGQKSVYICCFSRNSDKLSQWRAYADDGKGVSIGFNLNNMAKTSDRMVERARYTKDVIDYNNEPDVEIISDQIYTVFKEHKITTRDEQIEVFLHELIPVLVKYKNHAFHEEREVRLVYCDDMKFEKIVDSHGAFNEKAVFEGLDHHFRTIGDNNITEYVKLDFTPKTIKKICIGPKCLLSENDVKRIVKAEVGIDVTVTKSEARSL